MAQESLLPGTKAITRSTAELTRYGKKYLVRLKLRDGTTWQRQFEQTPEGADLAHACFFTEMVPRLAQDTQEAVALGEW
jgi:hypothetical protein